jgi:FkbM family methyltransferase
MLAEDPVLNVEEFGGIFRLDSRSDLFRRLVSEGRYEPELAELCRHEVDPSRDALDIGANVGFFSVLIGGQLRSGRVLAVEPVAAAYARLTENIERNGLTDRVATWRGAAGEGGTDHVKVNVVEGREEYSSIRPLTHPQIAGEPQHTELVPLATIDSLVESWELDPCLVKVDVEGTEAHVMRGAACTLRRFRPVVVLEAANYLLAAHGESAASLAELMRSFEYDVRDLIGEPIVPTREPAGQTIVCRPM